MNKFYDLKLSDTIPQMEKELYFNQNKEVLGLSEFTNNYVEKILEEENKQELEKQDFEGLKIKLEEIKKYQKIIDKYIYINVNISIIEKFILGQDLEEFEDFFLKNQKSVQLKEWKGINEKLKKLFELEGFNKEILIELAENEEVISLIIYGIEENFKKLFELKGFNKEMLIELVKIKEVVSLIESKRGIDILSELNRLNKVYIVWKLFEIKTKEDLIDFAKNKEIIDFIINVRKEILEEIVKYANKEKLKLNEIIDLFLQNGYVEDKENIILGKYNKLYKNNILDLYNKYKAENKINNSYLGNQKVGDFPFSIIDLNVDFKISGVQERSRKYDILEQTFYDININSYRKHINADVQLVINRLFAPFFPMTRLLKLVNGTENYVSIDVKRNKDGINLCKLRYEVPEEIEKFFIMIYQFLTIDYDRDDNDDEEGKIGGNLGKENIIYDFDYMYIIKSYEGLKFLGNTFINKKLYNEMEEILFTLKDYLLSEVDELLEIYKDKEDVRNILKRLRDRLKILNFSNLIYYNEVEKYGLNFTEIEKFAREADKKYYQ